MKKKNLGEDACYSISCKMSELFNIKLENINLSGSIICSILK
jgi:hypothetical protein